MVFTSILVGDGGAAGQPSAPGGALALQAAIVRAVKTDVTVCVETLPEPRPAKSSIWTTDGHTRHKTRMLLSRSQLRGDDIDGQKAAGMAYPAVRRRRFCCDPGIFRSPRPRRTRARNQSPRRAQPAEQNGNVHAVDARWTPKQGQSRKLSDELEPSTARGHFLWEFSPVRVSQPAFEACHTGCDVGSFDRERFGRRNMVDALRGVPRRACVEEVADRQPVGDDE